jgi:hypothetical protein
MLSQDGELAYKLHIIQFDQLVYPWKRLLSLEEIENKSIASCQLSYELVEEIINILSIEKVSPCLVNSTRPQFVD